jgi:SNF2 family DNA or RNA helicase
VTLPFSLAKQRKLIGVPFAEDVRNLFPEATEVQLDAGRTLLLKHEPTETFMLRKLGYDIPAPILSHYAWPGQLLPFEVQLKTCAMLTMNPRGYVLNGMGTGKTRAALWAWDYLYGLGLCRKLLVVAPLSTLRFVWAKEIFETLPHRKCAVLYGDAKKRRARLQEDVDIYIINHDGVKVLAQELETRADIDIFVLDELAVYRNGGSARTKLMRKMAHSRKWVWGMTGSPMPTSPTDVWGEAIVVNPQTVPRYFGSFRNDLMLKVANFKYVPKEDATERAYKVLQPAVRFTLDDVVELPEIVERMVEVEMGSIQKDIYKALMKDCYAAIASHEITAANAGAVMMKLLQVACGWVYSQNRGIVGLDNNKRIEALLDGIQSTDRKVLVFSPFKHALSGISNVLTENSIDHANVSGDTPAGERDRIFNLFQNTPKFRVLNAHPQCLAHGVTLTAADTIIWFAPVTSLEIYEQANARIRRVGQKHKQLILHFQSTPVEKRIYSLLQQHKNIQAEFLSLFEAASNS